MSKRIAQTIILAEDANHQKLVRSYLKRMRGKVYSDRTVRFQISPSGRGSAEQYVRENYPKEVREFRRRRARGACFLVVMVDADKEETSFRQQQLTQSLKNSNLSPRQESEPIVVLIPKRHVETWIRALLGNQVDEDTDYKRKLPAPSSTEIRLSAEKLYEVTRPNAEVPGIFPPSLKASIPEWLRIP